MKNSFCKLFLLLIIAGTFLVSCKHELTPNNETQTNLVQIHPVIALQNSESSNISTKNTAETAARTIGLAKDEMALEDLTNIVLTATLDTENTPLRFVYDDYEAFSAADIRVKEGKNLFTFSAECKTVTLYGETTFDVKAGEENNVSLTALPQTLEGKYFSVSLKINFPTESEAVLKKGYLYAIDEESTSTEKSYNSTSFETEDNEDGTSSITIFEGSLYAADWYYYSIELRFEDKDHNIYIYNENIVPQSTEIHEEFTIPKFFTTYTVTYHYGTPQAGSDELDDTTDYYAPTYGFSFPSSPYYWLVISWYFDEDLTQAVTGDPGECSGDVTLYAKWEEVPHYAIKVLDEDGNEAASGSFIKGTYQYYIDSTTCIFNYTNDDPNASCGSLSINKENYIVSGLYSDSAFTQKIETFTNYPINSDTTIYAKFDKAATISIYGVNEEETLQSITISQKDGICYSYLTGHFSTGSRGMTSDKNIYKGLYFDEECTAENFVEDQKIYYPTKDTTIYAITMEPYTYRLTLYDEDGSTVLFETELVSNCYCYNHQEGRLEYTGNLFIISAMAVYYLPEKNYLVNLYTDAEYTNKVIPETCVFVEDNVNLYLCPNYTAECPFECDYMADHGWSGAVFTPESDWDELEIQFAETPDTSIFAIQVTTDQFKQKQSWGDEYYNESFGAKENSKVKLSDYVDKYKAYGATAISAIKIVNKTDYEQSIKVKYAKLTKTDGSTMYIFPKKDWWGTTVKLLSAEDIEELEENNEYNIKDIKQYATLVNTLAVENESSNFVWDLLDMTDLDEEKSGAGYIWRKNLEILYPQYVNAIMGVYTPGTDKGNSGDDTVFEEEDCWTAAKNFKAGWNLSNSLDSNSYSYSNEVAGKNGWIVEYISNPTPKDWETAWGQPVTTQEIADFVLGAGFNSIRIPVTWAEHLDEDNNIDAAWMARVKEVVDYFYNKGAYCIVNVHHDGGENGWIKASKDSWDNYNGRFEKIWQQIAEEFKDYDERLVFESMNEVLDADSSWAAPTADEQLYINKYNQLFVDTVRASTSENNQKRNLIVQTYAGGAHFDGFEIPTDTVKDHIIVEVHNYDPNPFCWSTKSVTWTDCTAKWETAINGKTPEQTLREEFADYKTQSESLNAPIIVGEYNASPKKYSDYSDYE